MSDQLPSEVFISFGATGHIRMWKTAEFPGSTRFIPAPAPISYADAHPWTVNTLGRFLLSLSEEEQARRVWGAYFTPHVEETVGLRDARTRHLSISWERVDGNLVGPFKDEANPIAMVIWTAQDERWRRPTRDQLEELLFEHLDVQVSREEGGPISVNVEIAAAVDKLLTLFPVPADPDEAGCNYPECGCCRDAICNAAVEKAEQGESDEGGSA